MRMPAFTNRQLQLFWVFAERVQACGLTGDADWLQDMCCLQGIGLLARLLVHKYRFLQAWLPCQSFLCIKC